MEAPENKEKDNIDKMNARLAKLKAEQKDGQNGEAAPATPPESTSLFGPNGIKSLFCCADV